LATIVSLKIESPSTRCLWWDSDQLMHEIHAKRVFAMQISSKQKNSAFS